MQRKTVPVSDLVTTLEFKTIHMHGSKKGYTVKQIERLWEALKNKSEDPIIFEPITLDNEISTFCCEQPFIESSLLDCLSSKNICPLCRQDDPLNPIKHQRIDSQSIQLNDIDYSAIQPDPLPLNGPTIQSQEPSAPPFDQISDQLSDFEGLSTQLSLEYALEPSAPPIPMDEAYEPSAPPYPIVSQEETITCIRFILFLMNLSRTHPSIMSDIFHNTPNQPSLYIQTPIPHYTSKRYIQPDDDILLFVFNIIEPEEPIFDYLAIHA